ncbi:MAG TPA: hypothetical protein VN372_14150 [Methanospirillum sp.]|nr:hypothetical protein [Methanospirillum sp.]
MSDPVKNYGIVRGNSRPFFIGEETITVTRLPGQVHMEFQAWRAEGSRPVEPKDEDQILDYVEYRSDFRTEDEMLMDLAILTLNANRTADQKQRFDINKQWLLEHVSGDMLEDLVMDVMDPFLSHLRDKNVKLRQIEAGIMKDALTPMLREVVKEEMKALRKRSKPSSESTGKSASIMDGVQSIPSPVPLTS